MSQHSNSPARLPDINGVIIRLLRKRKSSQIVFFTARVNESSHQLAVRKSEEETFTTIKSVPAGSIIRVFGEWGESENGTSTFFVSRIEEVHRYTGMMPDKHKGIAAAERHLNRTIDWATNEYSFRFTLLGADIVALLRDVLQRWGFREFNTGVLQRRFEGGLAAPFTTKCNANDLTYYLSLTSELKLKRLLAAGATRVCEIGQSFRNEGLSRVHSPEFTLLEAYGVDMTYLEIMGMVEEMTIGAARLAEVGGTLTISPFKRITYRQICQEIVGRPDPTLEFLMSEYPDQFVEGMPLFTWTMKLLETIVAPHLVDPTFVTELPAGLSPLVRRSKHDPSVTDRSFLFAKGYFICDIYADESDPSVLEHELLEQASLTGRNPDPEYLQCIRLGIPPTSGVGLGVNRLHMLFLPEELPHHIRETILYPLG